MNQLAPEKQQAIIQGYEHGLSVRKVAESIQCSPITARTYLRLNGSKIRTISKGMLKYHELKHTNIPQVVKSELCLSMMMKRYNLKPITNPILSCGKTRKDCVDCGNIFSEGCGFCF
jgi:hypothetical protein